MRARSAAPSRTPTSARPTSLTPILAIDRRANLLHVDEATVDGRPLARDVRWATSAVERMRGLLAHPPAAERALVLVPARQIHTFGMKYPIDVLFCDREGNVLHVSRNMKPRRVSRWVRGAHYAIELVAGAVDGQISRGSRVSLPARSTRL